MNESKQSRQMPMGALLGVVAIIAVFSLILLPALCRFPEGAKRAACPTNLKLLGLTFRMYAGENGGAFPHRAPYDTPVSYMFATEDLYPDYWGDAYLLLCPSDTRRVDARGAAWVPETEVSDILFEQMRQYNKRPDWTAEEFACFHYLASMSRSYVYIGHLVWDWQAVRALEDARASALHHRLVQAQTYDFPGTPCAETLDSVTGSPAFRDMDSLAPDGNVPAFGAFDANHLRGSVPEGQPKLHRLREGVERYFGEDHEKDMDRVRGSIPVMWEAVASSPTGRGAMVFNHMNPPGGSVLYMDGHCEHLLQEKGQFPYGPVGAGPAYDLTPQNLNQFFFGQG